MSNENEQREYLIKIMAEAPSLFTHGRMDMTLQIEGALKGMLLKSSFTDIMHKYVRNYNALQASRELDEARATEVKIYKEIAENAVQTMKLMKESVLP